MNNLKAFSTIFVSLILSLSFMSMQNPDTMNTKEGHFLIYVVVGVSALLIFLFVFFVLKGMKGLSSPFSSLHKKESQHEKSQDNESVNNLTYTSENNSSEKE